MQKVTLKKGILLLIMAASLCLNFTITHSTSADPPTNDRKVAVVTLLGDSSPPATARVTITTTIPRRATGAATIGRSTM